LAAGPIPPEAESMRAGWQTSMLYFSDVLIIGLLFFLLMFFVAGGGWERVIGVCLNTLTSKNAHYFATFSQI